MNLSEAAEQILREHKLKRGGEYGRYIYRGWIIQKTEDTGNWNVYDDLGNGVDTGSSLKQAKQIVDWNIE